MMKIHTAVKGKGDIAHSLKVTDDNIYFSDKVTVFQHDICDTTIPAEYKRADAVHSIIAWKDGYKKFTENTIAEDSTFDDYLRGIKTVCESLHVPIFILCGKSFVKKLEPQRLHPVRYEFHNCNAVYAVWNYNGSLPDSVNQMQEFVGKNFNCILDFCCGFGSLAFYSNECILSDINTECIEYIKNQFGCTNVKTKGRKENGESKLFSHNGI